eukprot:12552917-Alexandrium_andersonii.AAC.1
MRAAFEAEIGRMFRSRFRRIQAQELPSEASAWLEHNRTFLSLCCCDLPAGYDERLFAFFNNDYRASNMWR